MFPLTELMKAKVKLVGFGRMIVNMTFENVKSLLSSSPVLAAPCFDRAFMIQVCQPLGAGAVLLQTEDQGVVRPVSFFSKKCLPITRLITPSLKRKQWCSFWH